MNFCPSCTTSTRCKWDAFAAGADVSWILLNDLQADRVGVSSFCGLAGGGQGYSLCCLTGCSRAPGTGQGSDGSAAEELLFLPGTGLMGWFQDAWPSLVTEALPAEAVCGCKAVESDSTPATSAASCDPLGSVGWLEPHSYNHWH